MGQFKKSSNISGKFKGILIHEGMFMDEETGEAVDLIGQLEKAYGDRPFDITTTLKTDEDLDV